MVCLHTVLCGLQATTILPSSGSGCCVGLLAHLDEAGLLANRSCMIVLDAPDHDVDDEDNEKAQGDRAHGLLPEETGVDPASTSVPVARH